MATNKAGSSAYSYTVAPHLAAEFDVPLSDFAIAHPQYTHHVIGAFIFTRRLPATSASLYAKEKHSSASSEPLMLIMQRALGDSFGGYWDFPGGSSEPDSDQTLLDGVAREVFEETGFHVSRIRELVRVDAWTAHKGLSEFNVAKFSFVVDVYESIDTPDWEGKVRLSPSEHMKWLWVTAEEMEESAKLIRKARDNIVAKKIVPYAFVGIQGETAWEGFKTYLRLVGRKDQEAELDAGEADVEKL